jgi:hypothetical protein
MRAKLDENMPVDAGPLLAAAGWSVATVHDEGLAGARDHLVITACQLELTWYRHGWPVRRGDGDCRHRVPGRERGRCCAPWPSGTPRPNAGPEGPATVGVRGVGEGSPREPAFQGTCPRVGGDSKPPFLGSPSVPYLLLFNNNEHDILLNNWR